MGLNKKDEIRFWSHVEKRGTDECWTWKLSSRGEYGAFWLNGKIISPRELPTKLQTAKLRAA